MANRFPALFPLALGLSLCLLLVAVSCRRSHHRRHRVTGEEEYDLGAALPYIYDVLPEIYLRIASLDMSWHQAERISTMAEEYGILFDDADNFTGPSESCVECRAFIGALEVALERNNFTEFEEVFLDLCEVVVNASDGDLGIPVYMCPGIAENYLDHAYFVLSVSGMDQVDICVLWNECIYTDFDPPLPEETLVCRPPDLPATSASATARRRNADRHVKDDRRDLNGTVKVVHMTDIHVDPEYQVGTPTDCGMPTCCRDTWPGTGSAGYWGEYPCNQPISITDLMLQELATLEPDYVMYTGDNPPHTVWSDTYDSQMSASRLLASSFAANVPDVPVFYALGNHDIHPTNLYFHNRTEVQEGDVELASIWGPLAGFGPEQYETFENAAFYSMSLRPGLRVLTYNSNFAWLENFYQLFRDNQPDYEEMKAFMEDTLSTAQLNGEKVIMLGHHPTGQSQGNNEYSCYMTDLQTRYGDVIILHLSGHKHGDLYRLVRDLTTGETRGVQISSPAGGCHTDRNPSLRVFYLDPVTYDLLDADTYRVNLSRVLGEPDGSNPPKLDFGYRFTDEYDMVDLSPSSFEDFIVRMETDDALFEKYLWNEATAYEGRLDPCDAECRFEEICQMKNTAYPGYLACVGEI